MEKEYVKTTSPNKSPLNLFSGDLFYFLFV